MDALEIVKAWNQTLRIGDWQAARGILADDATSTVPEAPEGEGISCTTPDQIVDFLRSLKGELPDVEVVGWRPTALMSWRGSVSRRSVKAPTGSKC